VAVNLREWIADNIGYRFGGCGYAKYHDKIFNPIEKLIPNKFKNRAISDIGCGDGQNTLRIKRIFRAKKIIGYERNPHLIKKAKKRGLKVKLLDLNKSVPRGEMAVFSFAFHHIDNKNKVRVLKKVAKNFKYIFLIEPMDDIYHRLLDAGHVLSKERWLEVFDEALGKYKYYQRGNSLIVFYSKS
jgi:SAM-dependent methyltransferase